MQDNQEVQQMQDNQESQQNKKSVQLQIDDVHQEINFELKGGNENG